MHLQLHTSSGADASTGVISIQQWLEGPDDYVASLTSKLAATIIRTRDQAIWDGLVELGWTPPKGLERPR